MSDEVTCAIWDDQEPRRSIEQQRLEESREALLELHESIRTRAIWENYMTFFDRDGNCIRNFRAY